MIKKQIEFPLIDEYKKHFDINEHTVFAYDNDIYTNSKLPDFLIEHEETHLRQQNDIGLDNWVYKYINDNEFRLEMEVEAYRAQLKFIKDINRRNRMKFICAKDLSSSLYGNIIGLNEAMKLLNI